MEKLKKYILEHATIVNASILKVDSFLNHQIDPALMNEIGKEFAKHFEGQQITKILTIESSGIAPAVFAGFYLNVPVVFMRKGKSIILNDSLYQTPIYSYTKEKEYSLTVNKEFINSEDHILFIDDFLANGESLMATYDIIEKANATLVGAGIVIEKSFQAGILKANEKNINVYSLAKINKLYANNIEFKD